MKSFVEGTINAVKHQEDFWGANNVQYLDLGCMHTGLYTW